MRRKWMAVLAVGLAYMAWRKSQQPPQHRQRKDRRRPPMTPATNPKNPADAHLGAPGHNEEHRLDEGIEETFPASDPVSVHIE